MSVAELKKVELYYHKSVQESVARIIQRSGVCQIIESAEEPEARLTEAEAQLAVCEEQESYLRYLFRTLGSHYTDPVSSIGRMLGEKPAFSLDELSELAQETDLKELVSSVKTTESKLNELRIEISQLKVNAGILSNIRGFPYPLSVLRGEGTRTLKGVLGTLSAAQLDTLREDLTAYSMETELFAAPQKLKAKDAWVALLYAREREQEILALCVKDGMTIVDLPVTISESVAKESVKIFDRIAECEQEESAILRDLARRADEWMPLVQGMSDYWKILHDRYRALAASAATGSTVKTCFWIPAEVVPALQKQVESAGAVAFMVSDPTEEDHPPTLLENNAFNKPAEVLTDLYSPPAYGHRDPTPPMAPFFFLFFGMCLGDAGYAVVMSSVLWLLFKKYRKMPAGTQNFMRLFYMGAGTTFLYGLVTGGFFGDSIDVFPFMAFLRPLKDALLIVDPLKNPVAILGVSLLLGVVHLMFGLGVAAYDEFRRGRYADAVGGKISWILFVVGILFVGGGSVLPFFFYVTGVGMAVVGAVLIVWYAGRGEKNIFLKVGLGLYALYSSTAYLGDILSYSRLLALGLGSAVIGSVINSLGKMIAGVPYIGWTLAALVIVGGHVFSLAINLLGAFVHAMRLQYVEFFSKFYSGDGVAFNPLRFQTQYVEVFDKN
jgi:V/A-type H+-transporting ATPase subunit I